MVIAVLLMLVGALGPIAAIQWRTGHWLAGARWIARNSSVDVLYATPVAGLFLAALGLSIIWPPAIVLVFLAAGGFMWTLLGAPQRRRAQTSPQAEPRAHRARTVPDVSRPFSSRSEIARRTGRPGTARRLQTQRTRPAPTAARRDARRAG
jgi:predicted membrane metal-binding protein